MRETDSGASLAGKRRGSARAIATSVEYGVEVIDLTQWADRYVRAILDANLAASTQEAA